MKIKVPKQITVGSMTYGIVLTPNLEKHHHLLGQCLTDEGLIKIEPHSRADVRDQSLMHELVHAINDIFMCKLDEDNIERIAQGLTATLKRDFCVEFDWSLIEEERK